MEAKLSPRVGIVILAGVSTLFAANHLCARIALDHGASVATAVSTRAASTALVLFAMMRLQAIPIALPRGLRGKGLAAGMLIAAQSYCIYSAVALIPPALALLVFQTSPMLYLLLSWALGKELPRAAALPPMLLALAGLILALGLRSDQLATRWSEIGAGVTWALASSACMTMVYYLNAHALTAVDGRLRTFVMTTVTAAMVLGGGAAAQRLALPATAAGWAGLVLLTVFYCVAIIALFVVLPKVPAASTAALNFEPIALLGLSWVFLDQTVTPLQVLGAVVTVSAIAWLGFARR
ncbi:MAG: DMT family transporter [Betaproteobacteria bacterium]|nr:MAG: DMT family transporter [Betaproteobacteria bacterium]